MTSPDRKDVLVAFHGMIHSPFNLEGIAPVVNHFGQLLGQSSGRNVLYRESASFTPEIAETSKVVIEHHGLVDPLLGDILRAHRVPTITQEILDHLRQAIDRVGYRAIEMGLVPLTMGQDFFLSYELEKLRGSFPFDIGYESHSEATVREISEALIEVQALEGNNITHWMNGDIDRIVANKKRVHQTTRHLAELREPDIVNDLASIAKNLAREKKSSVLFVLFGGAHASMIDALQHDLAGETDMSFDSTNAGLPQSPEVVIQEGLQRGQELADDVYAQHFLETIMSVSAQTFVMSRRRFTDYAEHYEIIVKTITGIATSFSLDDIRQISRERRDILEVLRQHPSGAPLLPYISRLLI